MHAEAADPIATVAPTVPLVVQVGFAGSRELFDGAGLGAAEAQALEADIGRQLTQRLRALPALLGLHERHFLCGVSQVAVGGDTLFSQACVALGWWQRVLLPQWLDAYLGATDAQGRPDFTPAQASTARALLALPHVIEQRVASATAGRREQFEDVNLAIVAESDVVVCLLRAAAPGRPGGTRALIEHAARAGKPVLQIEVSLHDGSVSLSPLRPLTEWPNGAAFKAPGLPAELRELPPLGSTAGGLPSATAYVEAIRHCASQTTRRHSGLFKRAAVAIIVLHIAATVLAILAGKIAMPWVIGLLALEVLLLAIGLRTHHVLHRSSAGRVWAVTRLLAETMRSLESAAGTGAGLDYALALPFPAAFTPLLRTAAVLQAVQQRAATAGDWSTERSRYLDQRLGGERGQLRYFERAARSATAQLHWAHRCFWLFSGTALLATAAKLLALLGAMPDVIAAVVGQWSGLFAVALPVAAVGFLSWAAASDLEARAKTYADMQRFLGSQALRLAQAGAGREFTRLVRETELRILDENLGWFSRRLFSGVS